MRHSRDHYEWVRMMRRSYAQMIITLLLVVIAMVALHRPVLWLREFMILFCMACVIILTLMWHKFESRLRRECMNERHEMDDGR